MGNELPKIDPVTFDVLVGGPELIWGIGAIAKALNLSESTVKRLAKDPGFPVSKPSGRYFAYRADLILWLRSK